MRRSAATIALWVLLAPSLGADPAAKLPTDIHGLSTYLGVPARPERVQVAWEALRTQGAAEAIRLAAALGISGGAATLETLDLLLRDRNADVRLAATRAAGRVGLRAENVVQRLRDAVRRRTGGERRAAMLALGRLGDGRDVSTLLQLCTSENKATALAAFRALGPLTGRKLPAVHARWSYWWNSAGKRLKADVASLLDRLEEARKTPGALRLREQLARQAWVDLPLVRTELARWLGSRDDDLRLHATVLAGELRLPALGRRVERLRMYAKTDGPLRIASKSTLKELGLLLPAASEPESVVEADRPSVASPEAKPASPPAAPR